ncbi:unnamed protein product [Gadus morhua 'NCC']
MLSKAMDELQRIVGGTNSRYIEEVKGRWADFCAKVQFYDVWKKALDIHWMSVESGEDPALYLEKRPLSSPVLLSDGSTTIVAVDRRKELFVNVQGGQASPG